jgi:hypothetical protein
MIEDETVADPRPEEMCDPFEAYWNSSPRYLIDVMSQFAPLTVKTKALLEPASTTKLLPDLVTPKAASAEEEREAAARRAYLRIMVIGEEEERNEGKNASGQPPGSLLKLKSR